MDTIYSTSSTTHSTTHSSMLSTTHSSMLSTTHSSMLSTTPSTTSLIIPPTDDAFDACSVYSRGGKYSPCAICNKAPPLINQYDKCYACTFTNMSIYAAACLHCASVTMQKHKGRIICTFCKTESESKKIMAKAKIRDACILEKRAETNKRNARIQSYIDQDNYDTHCNYCIMIMDDKLAQSCPYPNTPECPSY